MLRLTCSAFQGSEEKSDHAFSLSSRDAHRYLGVSLSNRRRQAIPRPVWRSRRGAWARTRHCGGAFPPSALCLKLWCQILWGFPLSNARSFAVLTWFEFRDLRNVPSLCVPFKVVGSRSVPASYLPLEDAVPLEIQGSGECFLLSAFLLESWGLNAVGSTPLPASFYPMGYDFVFENRGGERDQIMFGYTRRGSLSPTGPLSRLSYSNHYQPSYHPSIIAFPVYWAIPPERPCPVPIPGIRHLITATGSAELFSTVKRPSVLFQRLKSISRLIFL